MKVIETTAEMQKWVHGHEDKPIAAIYTMGALHAGHAHLMKYAHTWVQQELKADCYVVASIFINPTQFNNATDLEKYPRTFAADLQICQTAGVDALFHPSVAEMYPAGIENTELLDAGDLKNILEGESRPGHFDGVVTVVNKLFAATKPQYAFFGEKDLQQLIILKQFVANHDLPIKIIGVPTVRDEHGVALSSRNARLTAFGYSLAEQLPVALNIVNQAVSNGINQKLAVDSAINFLNQFPEIEIQYLQIKAEDLSPAPDQGKARALIAVVIEGVRLIDNLPIQIRKT